MGQFKLWIEGKRGEAWKNNMADKPDNEIRQKIILTLQRSGGVMPWTKLQQLSYVPAERFTKIIEELVNQKLIDLKVIPREPDKTTGTTGGYPQTIVFIRGTDVDSVSTEQLYQKDQYEQRILEMMRANGGTVTMADLKDEHKTRSSIGIMRAIERMKKKGLVDYTVVNNKYRRSSAIIIFFPENKPQEGGEQVVNEL